MPSKDSILKAELRNITKKVEIIETGFFVVDLKDNKTVYDVSYCFVCMVSSVFWILYL